MPFANTVREKRSVPGGFAMEFGTWALTGGDTTGVITANTALDPPDVAELLLWSFSSDGGSAALTQDRETPTTIRVTSAANDTGFYCLLGRAA